MNPFVINGDQDLKVTAPEAALILDSLSVQPYNKVSGLIAKLYGQIQQNHAKPPEGRDAQPEAEGAG